MGSIWQQARGSSQGESAGDPVASLLPAPLEGDVTGEQLNELEARSGIIEDDALDSLRQTALRYAQEFPGSDVGAIEVSLGILRTQRAMAAAIGRHLDSLGLFSGLTGARYNLMRTLFFARDRRLAQNELGREMGVSRTNITNLIDGLERDGLVSRTASTVDRRVSYAQLTAEGEALLKQLMPAMVRFMEDACQDFSPEEKRLFAGLLRRFRRGLEERYLKEAAAEEERLTEV